MTGENKVFRNVREFERHYFPNMVREQEWRELMKQPPEVIGRKLAEESFEKIKRRLGMM